jgi:hypothetical protein
MCSSQLTFAFKTFDMATPPSITACDFMIDCKPLPPIGKVLQIGCTDHIFSFLQPQQP